ncbi:MAG: hypothetical protein JNL57_10425 [Bacteroidetes bacterium]|nr:hypothetical protein [Bacteroidota bacterium]
MIHLLDGFSYTYRDGYNSDMSPVGVILILVVVIGILGIVIWYLMNLQRLLETIRPENRQMKPGQVWLSLIPIFNLVWMFLMVGYIADSIAAELNSRNEPLPKPRPTYDLGLSMCICRVAGVIPILGVFANIASLVLWIIYWLKINEYQRLFASGMSQDNLLDS